MQEYATHYENQIPLRGQACQTDRSWFVSRFQFLDALLKTMNMDEDTQIITLKVKLGTAWGAEIEVPVDFTLNDLHFAIQKLVDFDDDHLYKFYISKTEHNRNRYTFACDDGGCEISISALFPLPTKTFLFYLFDFGDCWLFKISATRKNLKPIEAEVEYPRLVKETGEKPVQYGD